MPRTLYRTLVFTGVMMGCAQAISAQIVIRERVEVDGERTKTIERSVAAHLTGGTITGYYVYRSGDGTGAPYAVEAGPTAVLVGPVTVTASLGTVHMVELSDAFTPSSLFATYSCVGSGDYSRWTHDYDADAHAARAGGRGRDDCKRDYWDPGYHLHV